jgi:hypothetical protein
MLFSVLVRPEVQESRTIKQSTSRLAALQDNLTATAGKDNEIITVTFECPYPNEAQQILKAVIDTYVDSFTKDKRAHIFELEQWRAKVQTNLDKKQKELLAFKKANGALAFTGEKGNITMQKLASLQDQKQRALHRVEREKGQASQQKLQTAISVGATILGAFLGRKAVSATSVGRATTAARSATRIGREAEDVARAEESAATIDQRIADLGKELEAAIATLDSTLDAQCISLREIVVTPRKSDIAVGNIALLWTPWRKGADGFPVEA